jgi:Lhr-like helicase
MIDHKQNRENIIRDLKLNLIGPSPTGKPIKIDEMLIFDSYEDMRLPYRQFNSDFENNEGDEILNNLKPSERYGLGVLYPVKLRSTDEDEESENLNNDELDRSKAQSNRKLNSKNIDLNNDIENLKNDLNIEVEKDLLPSSFSLSFLVDPSITKDLKFVFTGGFYKQPDIDIEYKNKDGETKKGREWYFRSSFECNGLIDINNASNKIEPNFSSLPNIFDLRFQSDVRNYENHKIITFSVANFTQDKKSKRRNLDENSIYQSQLRIFSENYCILPYPKAKNLKLNQEEQINDLLYRDKRNYAIGHGISADWGVPDKKTNYVNEISSQAMPIVDVPNISPDIYDDNNQKIEIPFYNLTRAGNFSDGLKSLKNLHLNYVKWIDKIENHSKNLSSRYKVPSETIIKNCRIAAERINNGIFLIEKNEELKLAFQIANEAIMYQQYRTSIPSRSIKFDSDGNPLKGDRGYQFTSKYDDNFDLSSPEYQKKKWRPFQIAFILMNLDSLSNPNSSERNIVDLLWFPTGGGKTEAYLGLSAFQLALRRIRDKSDFGTDVIMRYTLRLLTAQQFHRASGLIYALEHIRKKNIEILGEHQFSIGIWIGGDSTYNTNKQAHEDFKKILIPRKKSNVTLNKFHISGCSWCGAKFQIKKYESSRQRVYGFKENNREKRIFPHCPDAECEFHSKLPTYTCDEDLYREKPSFLIATIDKFALLSWRPNARNFFGIDDKGEQVKSPPNLIIQDELHLISGPLGSMSGLYETVVEELCTNRRNGHKTKPKIISSTATIKNFSNQIKALFAREDSSLFPPPGLSQSDNFFSRIAKTNDQIDCKKFVGIYAPGLRSLLTSQIRTFTSLLQSANYNRIEKRELTSEEKDPWWTLVSFYSSLFDLGSARSILSIDMESELKKYKKNFAIEDKNIRPLPDPTEILELTAAQKDSVEENLQKLSSSLNDKNQNTKPVDICLSSSVIEVGVDITRISLLSIVSAPKSVSQYIQVSGRVGRDWHRGKSALVITIYSPTKPRDRSLYEQFRSYHEQLYSWVEPTSVTPFCEPVLERSLHSALFAYARQTSSLENAIFNPGYVNYENKINKFKEVILDRVKIIDPNFVKITENYFDKKISLWKNRSFDSWETRKKDNEIPLLIPQGSYLNEKLKFKTFQTMTSMRNVDAECMPYIFSNLDDESESV